MKKQPFWDELLYQLGLHTETCLRPHQIESMFWFQNVLDLYARVRKQNTSQEKNTGIFYTVINSKS